MNRCGARRSRTGSACRPPAASAAASSVHVARRRARAGRADRRSSQPRARTCPGSCRGRTRCRRRRRGSRRACRAARCTSRGCRCRGRARRRRPGDSAASPSRPSTCRGRCTRARATRRRARLSRFSFCAKNSSLRERSRRRRRRSHARSGRSVKSDRHTSTPSSVARRRWPRSGDRRAAQVRRVHHAAQRLAGIRRDLVAVMHELGRHGDASLVGRTRRDRRRRRPRSRPSCR